MTIRVGIIGFGFSGRLFHRSALAADPSFSVDIVSTSDPARARIAEEGGARVVASADELLARSDSLDLVVVATPPDTHARHVTAALERGLAVVTDKPFATSIEEGEAMVAAAERAGRPLFVYQNRRWDSEFLTARALVGSGRLGRVHRFESAIEKFSGEALRADWQGDLDRARGGGVLFDLGAHLVDQALELFGPARVEAARTGSVLEGRASEDEAFLWLRHDSGVVSHLAMSRVARVAGPRMRLLGSQAGWSVSAGDRQEDQLKAGGSVADEDYGVVPEADWGVLVSAQGEERVPAVRGDHPAFYRGVAAALRGEGESPVPPEGPLAALRVIEEAHRLAAQAK